MEGARVLPRVFPRCRSRVAGGGFSVSSLTDEEVMTKVRDHVFVRKVGGVAGRFPKRRGSWKTNDSRKSRIRLQVAKTSRDTLEKERKSWLAKPGVSSETTRRRKGIMFLNERA